MCRIVLCIFEDEILCMLVRLKGVNLFLFLLCKLKSICMKTPSSNTSRFKKSPPSKREQQLRVSVFLNFVREMAHENMIRLAQSGSGQARA